jgi:hypothetical protein
MDIEQSFRKYVAQRRWMKLLIISKYYQKLMTIKENGYYVLHMAFYYTGHENKKFNRSLLALAHIHGFHIISELSTNRDQFLVRVLKNTVDQAFEREIRQMMKTDNIQPVYEF